MALALYLDHNVPRAIASGLRQRGVDVLTAREDGAHELSDPGLEKLPKTVPAFCRAPTPAQQVFQIGSHNGSYSMASTSASRATCAAARRSLGLPNCSAARCSSPRSNVSRCWRRSSFRYSSESASGSR